MNAYLTNKNISGRCNNNKTVHGRSEFKPKYNGKDRFLIRCFGMLDEKYQRTSYARPDNNIMFSAIYS